MRPLKEAAGVTVEDIAKRLIDYGFHAPTMSFPVPGTLMIEPTESESLAELDRFCDAMIAIRGEVRAIEKGEAARDNNVLRNAPHTMLDLADDKWERPYSRAQACFPLQVAAKGQVLVPGEPDRQRLRRPQSLVLLPLDSRAAGSRGIAS